MFIYFYLLKDYLYCCFFSCRTLSCYDFQIPNSKISSRYVITKLEIHYSWNYFDFKVVYSQKMMSMFSDTMRFSSSTQSWFTHSFSMMCSAHCSLFCFFYVQNLLNQQLQIFWFSMFLYETYCSIILHFKKSHLTTVYQTIYCFLQLMTIHQLNSLLYRRFLLSLLMNCLGDLCYFICFLFLNRVEAWKHLGHLFHLLYW